MLEKRLLQIAVAVAGLVPVAAGALGALRPELLIAGPAHALTHGAYLSGLLLGLGLAFWSLILAIERQGHAFGLLTGLVVLGGLARALTAARLDAWSLSVVLPLVMELGVTPALWLWQRRVSSLLRPE
ncbi:MAG TPA: DUF4345 family protein [Rhizomicrobium sp.]|jgi:hypothetical protein|nr:DUF4345 family protein [Rhizomicrobium sp.]